MNRYGININILHLTISHALTISHLTISYIKSKRQNILPTRTSFFISNEGKIKGVQEFQIKFLEFFTEHDILHF